LIVIFLSTNSVRSGFREAAQRKEEAADSRKAKSVDKKEHFVQVGRPDVPLH